MQTSDWIAAASGVVALGATVFAGVQARAAKQANATADQANAISQEANETAKQALEVARAQFEAERQAQHEAAGPVFEVAEAVKEIVGEWYAKIKLRHTGGAALESARITVSGDALRCLRSGVTYGIDEGGLTHVVWEVPAQGATFDLLAELEWNHDDPPNLRIALDCVAHDGRSWTRTLTAQPVEDDRRYRQMPRGRRRYGQG